MGDRRPARGVGGSGRTEGRPYICVRARRCFCPPPNTGALLAPRCARQCRRLGAAEGLSLRARVRARRDGAGVSSLTCRRGPSRSHSSVFAVATTVAANVNEMRASGFCSVRRTRGVADLALTYLDATDARESSRGAIYLIGDAQLAPRLGAATWRPLFSAPTSAAAATTRACARVAGANVGRGIMPCFELTFGPHGRGRAARPPPRSSTPPARPSAVAPTRAYEDTSWRYRYPQKRERTPM